MPVSSCISELLCEALGWSLGSYGHLLHGSVSKKKKGGGAWVAQSVERPTSAQVMISRFVSSSPASGSVLLAWALEPASDSVSPSLSTPPLLALCLSEK